MDEEKLQLLKKNFELDYLTLDQLHQAMQAIKDGLIHPGHKGCDFTLEVSVGVPIMEALTRHMGRNSTEPSLYQMVYEKYENI